MNKLAYSIPEAVAASGIGRTKLYAFMASGQLKRRKAGKRSLILASDLQSLLESLPEHDGSRGEAA